MEYNLCDDLKLVLGSKFSEKVKDFSALGKYIELRLPMLVYRDGSIQHYGTSHSIFYLNDKETNKIYQGVWDLDSSILTIGPVNSFNKEYEGALIKVSCCNNEITLIKRNEDELIIENIKEEQGIQANTKIYPGDLWENTALEYLQFVSSCCNSLPDYEFYLKNDDFGFVFDTYTNMGEVTRDINNYSINQNNSEAISTYIEKIDKLVNKNTIYQMKKTI